MSQWEMVKLGTVCDIARGGSPRPISQYLTTNDDGINWIKIGDTELESKYITKTKEKIIQSGVEKSRYVKCGDFLLSNSMSFGRPYILRIDGCIHDGWLVIKDKKSNFLSDYLYYSLSSKSMYQQFKKLAVGCVVNNLNSEMVRNVLVPLPPMEKQKEIAHTLDTIQAIISKRKLQISELDTLVKGKFVEMFGDPVENPMGWEMGMLGELIDILTGVPFESEHYTKDGIKICGGLIITPFGIEWKNCKFWDNSEGLETFLLEENDIVMALDRPWISDGFKIALIKKSELPSLLIQRTARIRTNSYNPTVLLYLLKSECFALHCNVTGSLVPHISTKDVKTFKTILPPLPLQEEFAAYVQKVEQVKAKMEKSLVEMERLYRERMEDFFGVGGDND